MCCAECCDYVQCWVFWLCAVLCIVGWFWVCCFSPSTNMFYVSLPIPKELLRFYVEPLVGSDIPVRLHLHRKRNTGFRMCIHMRFARFDHAIPVNSVNMFTVYYSYTRTAVCHNLSATILHRAACQYTAVPSASVPWFRFFTQ